MEYFYIDAAGRQQGPVSPDCFPRLGVTEDTPVWRQGMADWQRAGTLSELDPYLNRQPEGPPPYNHAAGNAAGEPAGATPGPVTGAPQDTAAGTAHADSHAYPPSNFIVWSVICTFCCCSPLGIVGLYYGQKVNGLWAQCRYDEAYKAADCARIWTLVGMVLALFGFTLHWLWVAIAYVCAWGYMLGNLFDFPNYLPLLHHSPLATGWLMSLAPCAMC